MTLESLLHSREVGVRLAQGPWQQLGKTRWGVPVVGFLSLEPFGEYVVELDGKKWVWVKGKEKAHEETDPLLRRAG